jgi:hypothetical protein
MSTENFFTKLIKRLKAGKRTSPATSSAPPADEMMGKLIRMVEDTDEVEISCDDAFELLDRYVELEARGEDVAIFCLWLKGILTGAATAMRSTKLWRKSLKLHPYTTTD